MFESLLIANRGEIAVRIIRTAKAMGLRTIAVYSEADANALHVAAADEAYLIGPAPAAESYLNIANILAAAKEADAAAIHPGYGFLSENSTFATAVEEAGLKLVGPSARAIGQMGNKATAKAIMEEAGVPLLPGYHGADQSNETLLQAAREIGFPVFLKAAAGGGGRGIRPVVEEAAFEKQLKAARREAMGLFGTDDMLIERCVSRPRHIEVQIFADNRGQCIHLFERDCSIQRRHQKVLEEAPAPGLTPAQRDAMGKAAIRAAQAVGYEGAGTVEFIADVRGGIEDAPFYFLEMNTRLQVEHPVTEMITGLDLVEWQLRIAAGEPLPLSQHDITPHGHAIEARLYAENPAKKFFPSPGVLEELAFPDGHARLRIDTGAQQGDTITVHYDPMIAKLICHAPTRHEAAARLASALEQTKIAGIATNREFLINLNRHPAFLDGDLDTSFIETHLDTLVS